MNVLPWAGFVADFPDDQIESSGDIDVFGGRNVAVALGEIFSGLGCSQVSVPESAGDQGWEFDFYYSVRHRFWCRLQSFHPVFWLLFEGPSDSSTGAATYIELWREFGNALERDPRFSKILWRSFKEGPPDWDEVEAATEPPDRSFAEKFASVHFDQYDPKPGCLSALFGLPFIFFGSGWAISYLFVYKTQDRWEIVQTSIGFLLFGLVVFFWAKIRGWTDNLRSRFIT
jgi:hypothetical protein